MGGPPAEPAARIAGSRRTVYGETVRSSLVVAVVAALLTVPAAQAAGRGGALAETRVEGTYRVTYAPLNASGVADRRRWKIKPKCAAGACSLSVVSRAWKKPTRRNPTRRFAVEFDGRWYTAVARGIADCTFSDGTVVKRGYRYLRTVRFRVTRRSNGIATAFSGVQIDVFDPTVKGARRGCGSAPSGRSRITGLLQ